MSILTGSLKVAATMGVATAAIQATAQTVQSSVHPLFVPMISAVVGGVMSYAVLKTTVQKMESDVRDMRRDMSEMYSLLRDAMTKIAHMEGRLDHRS